MRRTLQSLALIFALSATVIAGEMPCPVNSPTQQQATSTVQESSADVDIATPTADETEADSLTYTVLNLLVGVFTLV